MLRVAIPSCRAAEINWTVSVIFRDFLGVAFSVHVAGGDHYEMRMDGRSLTLPDCFFAAAHAHWLSSGSLPAYNGVTWDIPGSGFAVAATAQTIPVILGRPTFSRDEDGNGRLGVDVFGSVFVMLSRYEEAVLTERDRHDRFPATASLAYSAGFLDRPVVDEWVELLWGAMQAIWPGLARKKRIPQVAVSCDVDHPYSSYVLTLPATARKVASDLLRRRSVTAALRSVANAVASRNGSYHLDPNNTFDWIMTVNESAGNTVTFNFLAGCTDPEMDGFYSIDEPRVRALIRSIHERGHRIGLHGSYGTYMSPELQRLEVLRFQEAMREEGIATAVVSNRQHYLRWNPRETARNLEEAGISVDSTLGYADRPGFRCGTCHEFQMFDLIERRPLRLTQSPLLVMEDTVLAKEYLAMGHTDGALELMRAIKERAFAMRGSFTLLWHNTSLRSAQDRALFLALINTDAAEASACAT